ncbi:MAG: hypothetical protein WBN69_13385, partial [Eudoraea sp.]
VYGVGKAAAKQADEQNLQLGGLAVHGENNALAIPISALTRQHWNPLYDLVEEKRRAFVPPLECSGRRQFGPKVVLANSNACSFLGFSNNRSVGWMAVWRRSPEEHAEYKSGISQL